LAGYYNKVTQTAQEHWLEGGEFEVVLCNTCGLIYQRQVPDDVFMAELYGNWLGKNDPLAPNKPQLPMEYYGYLAQEVLQIFEFLRKRKHGIDRPNVLDFGLGWGNWAQVARAFGGNVSGVEFSPSKIQHLKGLGFSILASDELHTNVEKFDFINTEQVLEHLANPAEVTASLIRLLKPGGIIKLSVPDGRGIPRRLEHWDWAGANERREVLMPIQPLEHINCFTSDSLNRFAGRFGLKRLGLPIRNALAFPADWSGWRTISKGLLRPIKRHVLKRGCYALYERA